jgi:predicted metalloprotease with PDZ domain
VVVRVTAGTPAAAAGLVPGDRILAIDGVAVENQATMLDRLKAAVGEVALAIDRRGRFMAAVMRSP